MEREKIFILSPASTAGPRCVQLLAKRGKSEIARRLHHEGIALGELFCFLSGLYFRGKYAYAQYFAQPGGGLEGCYIITSCFGLLSANETITPHMLRALAATPIASDCRKYTSTLSKSGAALASRLQPDAMVVLLGSIATRKYTVPLAELFGERLYFPEAFLGRGDMSRGALCLRSAAQGAELTYRCVQSCPELQRVLALRGRLKPPPQGKRSSL